MPDSTPNINETEIGKSLLLALASIYLPAAQLANVQKAGVAANAIMAAIALYRQRTGRPPEWKPSAEDWAEIVAAADAEIARVQAEIERLEVGSVTTKGAPISGGNGPR